MHVCGIVRAHRVAEGFDLALPERCSWPLADPPLTSARLLSRLREGNRSTEVLFWADDVSAADPPEATTVQEANAAAADRQFGKMRAVPSCDYLDLVILG
jgi:hypothetical protein